MSDAHKVGDISKVSSAIEAATLLSQSTYSGTVESAQSLEHADLRRVSTSLEAATLLSQSTYSGTVESAKAAS